MEPLNSLNRFSSAMLMRRECKHKHSRGSLALDLEATWEKGRGGVEKTVMMIVVIMIVVVVVLVVEVVIIPVLVMMVVIIYTYLHLPVYICMFYLYLPVPIYIPLYAHSHTSLNRTIMGQTLNGPLG